MSKRPEVFCADLKKVDEEGKWDEFNAFMDALQESYIKEGRQIALELGISEECASNVQYLRTRSRWTQEAEDELVRRDKEKLPQPNIMEWPERGDLRSDLK